MVRGALALWVLSVVGAVFLFGSVVVLQAVSRAVRGVRRKGAAEVRADVDAGRVEQPSAA